MNSDALTKLVELAFQYGPFFFSVWFLVGITRWAYKKYHVATPDEKPTLKAIFLVSFCVGTMLVIVSVIWWFIYRSGLEKSAEFITRYIPWFWSFLAWCLVLWVISMIAGIGAYFLSYPVATNARQGIRSYLQALFIRHAASRMARSESMDALIQDFCVNSGIESLPEQTNRVEAVGASIRKIAKQLRPQLDRCVDIFKRFGQIQTRLSAAASKAAPAFPECPSQEQLMVDDGSIRTARIRLFVLSIIILALITVNTGMLSEILNDLGFIPSSIRPLHIPLYVALAFGLTLVEAGVGVFHAHRPHGVDTGSGRLAPIIAICFALIIAATEGFFYSQVAPSKESLFHFPFDFQIRQESLFFLWGATLVMVLFSLGSIWMSSLEQVTRSSDFASVVARISKMEERFSAACTNAERSGSRIKEQTELTARSIGNTTQQLSSISASLTEINRSIPTDDEPSAPRILTSREAYYFMHISAVWLLITCALVPLLGAIGFYAIVNSFPLLPKFPSLMAALGTTASFVVLGLLVPRGELILDGRTGRRTIISGSYSRGKASIGLAFAIFCGFATIIWQIHSTRSLLAFWIGAFVLGTALIATTSQSLAFAKGLQLWLRSCSNLVAASVAAIWHVLGRIAFGCCYSVEILSLSLASPIFIVQGRPLPSFRSEVAPQKSSAAKAP